MDSIEIGELVSLKSNLEVKMTVSEVLADGYCVCIWLNKQDVLCQATFDKKTLVFNKKLTPEERDIRIQELVNKATKK